MSLAADDVIAAYVKVRDDLEEMDKAHKVKTGAMREKLAKLENWLQNTLQSQGLTSLKGEAGTAFIQPVANVKVNDWEQTLTFIKEKNLWELLDRRVTKSVVLDYLDTYEEPPPGIEVQRASVVRVRRG